MLWPGYLLARDAHIIDLIEPNSWSTTPVGLWFQVVTDALSGTSRERTP